MARYRPNEGHIQKWRRYQKHRFYFTEENREAQRGEAWEDLLYAAAYKPHARYFKGREYHLRVGEIVTSQRDMAVRWQWSRGRVRRFLEGLDEHGEAAHRTVRHGGHEATLITIYGLEDCPDGQRRTSPPERPTIQATIEEVRRESTKTLSSNKVQVLTETVLGAWKNRKKKGDS